MENLAPTRFYVASARMDAACRCTEALAALGTSRTCSSWRALHDLSPHLAPELIVVDSSLPGFPGPAALAQLCASRPATKFMVLTDHVTEQLELELFKAGVRGSCPVDASVEEIAEAARVVLRGEYWIQRSINARLLDEFIHHRAPLLPACGHGHSLSDLTHREREIAAMVAQGRCNKAIANLLGVTERTVKAHLTQVFRKLGVPGRLMLALQMKETSVALGS